MTKGIFEDREHALEAHYFHQQDARLIERLRRNAELGEIAGALAEKLQLDNPDLLVRARQLGITPDTAPALLLAPLVQVAWAEGSVGAAERKAVLRLARARGLDPKSPAYAQLEEWLTKRPADAIFDTALEVLRAGFAVLPRLEMEERIARVVDACRDVALASGKGLAPLLGVGSVVSRTETNMVEAIEAELRKPVIRRD
jgi:hypothetical protein